MSEVTPTLSQVLKDAINSRLIDMRVSIPAIVTKYDSEKQTVSAQPALLTKDDDGNTDPLPVVSNIPVLFHRANKAFITMPIVVGDSVLLIFSDRSIDRWKVKGGLVDPNDARIHDLTDAFAIPGGYPSGSVIEQTVDTEAIQIGNDKTTMKIHPDGKLQVENDMYELVTILSDLIQGIIDARVITLLGPMPLLSLTDPFPLIKLRLDTFKK